eukprot:g1985.t1
MSKRSEDGEKIRTSGTSDSEEDFEEEDPVVDEYPVYINANFEETMCVVQHVNTPSYRNLHRLKSARIRPEHGILELTSEIPRNPKHYDISGSRSVKIKEFTHVSERVDPKANFCAGVFNGKELILTPVDQIFKMKPTFKYLDATVDSNGTNTFKASQTSAPTENASPVIATAEAAVVKHEDLPDVAVDIKLHHKKHVSKSTVRRQNYFRYQKDLEQDPWVDLTICDAGTAESFDIMSKLSKFVDVDSESSKDNSERAEIMTPAEYVRNISVAETFADTIDAKRRKQIRDSVVNQHVVFGAKLDRRILPILSIRERVLVVMKHGRVVRFQDVARIVRRAGTTVDAEKDADLSDDAICASLESCANVVQGVWVLKSHIALKGDEHLIEEAILRRTSLNVMTEYEIYCRKFAVSAFALSKDLTVLQRDIEERATLLRPNRVDAILGELAQVSKTPDDRHATWLFRKDEDGAFNRRFPHVVAKHLKVMKERYESLKRTLARYAESGLPVLSNDAMELSDQEMDEEESSASRFTKLERIHKTYDSNIDLKLTLERIDALLKDPVPDQHMDGCTNEVQKLLREQGLLSKNAIKNALENKGHETTQLDRALKKVALQIPGRELYVLRDCGDEERNRFRLVVSHMYGHATTMRRSDVRETCKNALGREAKGALYNKVMNEFGVSDANKWVLRGGEVNTKA